MRGLVLALCGLLRGLNESPSKKEGKSHAAQAEAWKRHGLNESPSKKEGKWFPCPLRSRRPARLNESPSKKEGKCWSYQRPGQAVLKPQ